MVSFDFTSDCARCAALCCTELAFDASSAFAFAKAAGEACRHLTAGGRCGVHGARAEAGLGGCIAYECYGAGPRATALGGGVAHVRVSFAQLRVLHELGWLLAQLRARGFGFDAPLLAALDAAEREVSALAQLDRGALAELETGAVDRRVRALLRRAGDWLVARARERQAG